jgi:hypothetical protein
VAKTVTVKYAESRRDRGSEKFSCPVRLITKYAVAKSTRKIGTVVASAATALTRGYGERMIERRCQTSRALTATSPAARRRTVSVVREDESGSTK